jgi:hypothetical protein
MIKKLFLLFIKILPIITIYKGVTSGGKNLGPILNVGKVAFTQYEIKLVTNEVINYYKENNGDLINPEDFPIFLQDKYFNHYAKIARQLFSDDGENLGKDIWNTDFILDIQEDGALVLVKSAGPDKMNNTKDDIALDFRIRSKGSNSIKNRDNISMHAHEYSESNEIYEDGYDRDGFDPDGFDQDGYGHDGVHRDDM